MGGFTGIVFPTTFPSFAVSPNPRGDCVVILDLGQFGRFNSDPLEKGILILPG